MALAPVVDTGSLDPFRPRCVPGLEIQRMDDDLVLFNPFGNRVHLLNASGGAILALCDGTLADIEIAGELAAFYGLEYQRALAEVRAFLADLDAAGVLIRSQGNEEQYSRLRDEASPGCRALRFLPHTAKGPEHQA